MPVTRTIQEGESVSSLALEFGLSQDTIWNDPANQNLRKSRSRADVLLPGDQITIPDKQLKTLPRPTDAQHRFRRIGVPILFELQIFDSNGNPIAAAPYTLTVDGAVHTGTTDTTGYLKEFIPNDSSKGSLVIQDKVERDLFFGGLDPIETLIGVQKRLTNLGFDCIGDNGAMGRTTFAALSRFQAFSGLPQTGTLDDATRDAIRQCHDDRTQFEQNVKRPPASPF
jgi:hypothetical protein